MSISLYKELAQKYPGTTYANPTPSADIIKTWDQLPFEKRIAEIYSYVACNQNREGQRELRSYLFKQLKDNWKPTSGQEILTIAQKYFLATHNPETTFAFRVGENQLWLAERYKIALANQSKFFDRLFYPKGLGTIPNNYEYLLEKINFEVFGLLLEIWEGTATVEQLENLEINLKEETESASNEKLEPVQGPIILTAQVAVLANQFDLSVPTISQYLNDYISNLSLENLHIPTILELLATFHFVEMAPVFSKLSQSLIHKLLSIYVEGMEKRKDCTALFNELISTFDKPFLEVCEQLVPILSLDTLTVDELVQGLVGFEKLSLHSIKFEELALTYLNDFHASMQVCDENVGERARAQKALEIMTKLIENVSHNVYPKVYQRFLFLLLVMYINRDELPEPEWIPIVSELIQKPQLQEIPPELLYHPYIGQGHIHRILPGLNALKRFTFVKEDMVAQLLSVVPKNLEILELREDFFEENALEHLNSTTALKTLRLQTNNNFNGTTFGYFANNQELEILDLTHHNLSDQDLLALPSFKRLRQLGLAKNAASQNPLTQACLNTIAQCQELTHLDLSGSLLGMYLIDLSELKKLQVFAFNALVDQQQTLDLYVLSHFKNLRELECRNHCHAQNPTLVEQIVQNAPGLKVLDLGHDATPSIVVDEDLSRLHQLTNLNDLNLDRSQITHEGLNHLVGLPIQHLSLNVCEGINDQVFEVLSLFRGLKTLSLDQTAVTAEALAAWAADHPGVKILTDQNAAEINMMRKQDRGAYIWPDELPEYAAWTAMERGLP